MRSDWSTGQLGDFFEIVTGGTPPKSKKEMYGNFMPLVKPPELKGESIRSSEDYLSEIGAAASRILPAGSVMVSCIGNLGKVGISEIELATNQQINSIIPNLKKALPEFIYYLVQSPYFIKELHGLASGTTVPIVNKSKFKSISIKLPPVEEQKRIIAILDEAFAGIDAAIVNTEKNLANARELFESYASSVFSLAPSHWQKIELAQICSIKHGFAFKSEYFSDRGPYIVLTPGSFYESGGFRDQGKKTKFYVADPPAEYVLKKGDFLIAMTEQAVGLLGSCLEVPESGRFLHNQRLGLFEVHDGVGWHNDFFFHQFNTPKFRSAVQATASGVKVRHTSPGKLGAIEVLVPPFAEQAEVGAKLNTLLSETRRLEEVQQLKLASLTELKQSLLQKAFSGELTAASAENIMDEAVA